MEREYTDYQYAKYRMLEPPIWHDHYESALKNFEESSININIDSVSADTESLEEHPLNDINKIIATNTITKQLIIFLIFIDLLYDYPKKLFPHIFFNFIKNLSCVNMTIPNTHYRFIML